MQTGLEEQLGLYQKRIPIFTRSVQGRFRRFKTSVLVLAYTIYFLLPWLPWSRLDAPAQAVLFDLPGRRFLIFGLTVYPQDVIWLALLLFIAAILLFFVTGLVGRAFCGYFCFQTLWTDFFIWIEHKVQGERPARVRLYRQPWEREKLLKVGGTHALWLAAAFWTAFTFIAYFAYAPQLLGAFFSGQAAPVAYIAVAVLTLTTYASAGLMREQICTYICPYGRFQSVMYEPETLAVHYDARRGEAAHGRAAARAGQRSVEERHARGLGDCVDCGLCVQVCPVGIDIRDGLQYPCISCGLCIDACDSIMDSFNFQRGLIRYDSEKNLASATPAPARLHWKRLKIIGYGVTLVLMSGYLAYSIATRGNFDRAVNQVRQPLYVVLSNGDIRNRYQIRITNKAAQDQTYRITARGIPAEALDLGHFSEIRVKPGHSGLVQASVRLSPARAARTRQFDLVITPQDKTGEARAETVRFDTQGGGA
jgi:cytochrome c oxidase accessory protein FixG